MGKGTKSRSRRGSESAGMAAPMQATSMQPAPVYARMRGPARARPARLLTSTILASLTMAPTAYANPVDGVVVAGSASISSSGAKLDVVQASDRAVIDWRGFDIGAGEHTQFAQPSASSIALNRVNSNAPSKIDGRLSANGQVVVVNQSGILFGKTAQVDVSGLIASTADIDNDKFMAGGTLAFDKPGKANAAIVNEGSITAKEAGLVGLVAPNVINSGTITARLGKVHLASGDTATVDLYGDKLLEVAVSDQVTSQLVANTGAIAADGGSIAITAAAGAQVVNSLVSVSGTLQAQSVAEKNGKIEIIAYGSNAVKDNAASAKGIETGSSTVLVAATLDASGRKAGERGGSITVTGDNVGILSGSTLDASGESGGGTINIGGDYQGKGMTASAKRTLVEQNTQITANALNAGNGGRVIVWSDGNTQFSGAIEAKGGNASGDGGFVEVSGKRMLGFSGKVDTSATNGTTGTLLLDPTDITISSASDTGTMNFAGGTFSDTSVSGSNLNVTTLQNQLANNNVLVTTASGQGGTGNLTVSNDVTWSSAHSLTLFADNDINVNANLTYTGSTNQALTLQANNSILFASGADAKATGSGKLDITLNSDRDASGAGAINLGSGSELTSNGGNIILGGGAAPGSVAAYGTAADIAGIKLDHATLDARGGGNITLTGHAYTDGYGINDITSTIQTDGAGTITLTGVGGSGGNSSYGVMVDYSGGYAVFSSASGDITIDGVSNNNTGLNRGTYFTGNIDTTGGNVVINGSANNASAAYGEGTYFQPGHARTTGSGNITITGSSQNAVIGNTGLIIGYYSDTSTVNGNITMTGTGLGGNHTSRGISLSSGPSIYTTGTGNITLNGHTTGDWDITADSTLVTLGGGSNNGNITIIADTLNVPTFSIQTLKNLLFQTYTASGTIGVSGGTGDLQITSNLLNASSANTITIGRSDGSGLIQVNGKDYTFLPYNIELLSGSGNIEFLGGTTVLNSGKYITASTGGSISNSAPGSITTNNADIILTAGTVGNINLTSFNLTANGTGQVYLAGADITINASNIASANSNIFINAFRDILSGGNYLLQTSGTGNIQLTAGRDINISHDLDLEALGSGNITLRANNSILYSGGGDITTNGGAITLNSDRDASGVGAISLGSGTELKSNGGNILLGGGSGTITAGSGFAAGTSGNTQGIKLDGSTLQASGGNIIVNGSGYNGNFNPHGIYVVNSSLIETSGTGAITFTGLGTNAAIGNSLGIVIGSGGSGNIIRTTGSGNVTMNATARSSGSFGSSGGFDLEAGSSLEATGSGSIFITGIASQVDTGGYLMGVNLRGAVTANTGDISITGTGGAAALGGYDYGVYISGGTVSSSGGDITVTGTAGSVSSGGSGGFGITMDYAGSVSATGAGSVTLTGTAHGTDSSMHGVYFNSPTSTTMVSTVDGDLNITGYGSTDSSGNAYGVVFYPDGNVKTTGSGDLIVHGVHGYNGAGIYAVNGGNFQTTGTGDIFLYADHFTVGSNAVSSAKDLTIAAYHQNGYTGVAGGSGNLQIDNTLIAGLIWNGVLTIGRADGTGLMQVGAYNWTGNVQFVNGSGGIQFTGGNSTLTTGKSFSAITYNGGSITNSSPGSVTTNNADITILADSNGDINLNSFNLTANGTGQVIMGGQDIFIAASDIAALNNNIIINAFRDLRSGGNYLLQTSGTGNILLTAGRDIYFTHELNLEALGSGSVTLRANNSIIESGGGDITTHGGAITLNSDRDASGAGAISLGGGTVLTSGGGNITLGGGATPGSTAAYGTASNRSGIDLSGAELLAGSGSISLRGQGYGGTSNDNHGIFLGYNTIVEVNGASSAISLTGTGGGSGASSANQGIFMYSGPVVRSLALGGNITLNGTGGNTSGTGYNNNGISIIAGTITSAGAGNILVTGTGSNSSDGNNRGVGLDTTAEISSTGTGTVTVNGTGGNSGSSGYDNQGISLSSASTISSVTGAIAVTGTGGTSLYGGNIGITFYNNNSIVSTGSASISVTGISGSGGGNNYGIYYNAGSNVIGGASDNGGITITADSLNLNNFSAQTTGNVTLKAYTASTTTGVAGGAGNLQISSALLDTVTAGGITIGRADGTGLMQVGNYNWASNVSFINGSGGIEFLGGSSTLTTGKSFSATTSNGGDIINSAPGSVTTNNADITIVADSGGDINFNSFNLTANGTGQVYVGGQDVTISASNIAALNSNIVINALRDILSGGAYLLQTSGTGNILLTAGRDINFSHDLDLEALGSGSITLRANNSILYSGGGDITTNGGAITLNSDRDASGAGAISLGSSTVLTSTGGDITLGGGANPLIGSAYGTSGGYSYGIDISGSALNAGGGTISAKGTGYSGGISNSAGVYIHNNSTLSTTGSGAINLTGQAGNATSTSYGINIGSLITADGTTVTLSAANGNITLNGTGGAAADSEGIALQRVAISTSGTGNISMTGTAGTGSSYAWGVDLYGNVSVSTVDGNIALTGSGSGAGNLAGVVVSNATVGSTGAGNITLTGVTSGGSNGIWNNSGTVQTIGTGNITLNTDKLNLVTSNAINSAKNLTIASYTQSATTGVAGGAGTLQLDSSLLGKIAWGDLLTIGRADGTGLMQVGNYSWASNVSFINGSGGIEFLGGSSTLTTGKSFSATTSNGGDIINSAPGSVTTNNADITIVADSGGDINFNSFNLTANGTGQVYVGGQDVTISASNIAALNSNIVINALRDILSGGAYLLQTSGTGNILLTAGRDINFSHDLDLEALGSGSITLRANNSILYSGGGDITTNGGAITLNSDRDASGAGAISLGSGTVLTSNGGNITLGGGSGVITAGSGYAWGTAANNSGITLDGAQVRAGGGNIIANAKGYNGTGYDHGIYLTGTAAAIGTTGSGTINLHGEGKGSGLENHGIYLNGTGSSISSVDGNLNVIGAGGAGSHSNDGIVVIAGTIKTTGDGTITAQGTSGGQATGNMGIYISALNSIQATGTGNISVTGSASTSGTDDNYGVHLVNNGTISNSGTGSIAITGTGGGSGINNHGVYINGAATAVSSINGNINIIGTGSLGTINNDGVAIIAGSVNTTGSGSITVQGTGRGAGLSAGIGAGIGVYFEGLNAIKATGTGNISVTGTASQTHAYDFARGILINAGGVTAAGGNISITGTGGTGTDNNYGIHIIGYNSVISTTGNGTVTVIGNGGGAGTSDHGVVIEEPTDVISTVNGTLTVTGTGSATGTSNTYGIVVNPGTIKTTGSGNLIATGIGGTGGRGYYLNVANALQTTGTGNISVTGDSLFLNTSNTINSANNLTIAPYTQSTTTGVAGGAGTLQLDSTTLGRILWNGLLTIGRSDGTGLMQVGNYNWAGNVSFVNGSGGIEFLGGASTLTSGKSFSAITSNGGDIANSAPGSVDTNNADITITAGGGGDVNFTSFNLTANGTGQVIMGGQDVTISASNIAANNSDIIITALRDILSGGNYLLQTSGTGNILLTAGRDINFTHDLDLEATGSGNITLRANNSILYSGGGDITTNGGNITLNSDRDASGAGAISLGGGTVLSSGGGNITLGGGANPLTTAAYGTAGNNAGISNAGTINSGAGTISFKGTGWSDAGTANLYGIINSGTIQSSSGAISLTGTGGIGTGSNYGFYNTGTVTTVSGAIDINGTAGAGTGNSNNGVMIQGGYVTSTGTGNGLGAVTVTGLGAATGGAANYANGVDIYAGTVSTVDANTSVTGTGGDVFGSVGIAVTYGGNVKSTGTGNVTLSGTGGNGYYFSHGIAMGNAGTNIIAAHDGLLTLTGTTPGTTANGNYGILTGYGANIIGGAGNNGNIIVNADSLSLADFSAQTAGTIFLRPYTQSGTIGINGSAGVLQVTSALLNVITAANVTIGRNDGTGLMRIASADLSGRNYNLSFLNGSGSIQFDGGPTALTLAANKYLTAATASGDITSSADGGIVTSGTGTITLASGNDINFANDFDLTTASGDVTLRANNSILYSGGGDITTNGGAITLNSDRDASGAGAISLGGGTVLTSNGGNITLGGGSGAITAGNGYAVGTSANQYGIELAGATLSSSAGAVILNGHGYNNAAGGSLHGIFTNYGDINTTSGAITINGIGGNGKQDNTGVYFYNSDFATTSGAISITGAGGAASDVDSSYNSNHGIVVQGSTIASSGTGTVSAITLNGTGAAANQFNFGLDLISFSTISSVDANIILNGTGRGQHINNVGIMAGSVVVKSTGAGDITFTGASNAASNSYNSGVQIKNSSTQIFTTNGNLNITGTSVSNSGTYNNGVQLLDNPGVYTKGTGNLTLTGIGSAGAAGILSLASSGTNIIGGASDNGNITLIADTVDITDTTFQTLKDVILRPYTASTTTGVNGSSGTLQITSAILNAITSSSITIGRADGNGLMRIAGADLSSNSYNLNFLNGLGNIQFDGGGTALTLAANKYLTATTASGDITSGGNGGITTSGTGYITLASGNDINFANDFDLTTASGDVTLRANNSILYSGSGDITTNGGHITLNSDRDASGAGAISLGSGTVLASNGGDITLGGGSNPLTGYARGTASNFTGVKLAGAELQAGGGNISVHGTEYDSSAGCSTSNPDDCAGIRLTGAVKVQTTGSGTVTLDGVTGNDGEYGSLKSGILTDGSGALISTVDGNISLTGYVTPGYDQGGYGYGLWLNAATIRATGSGSLLLMGTGLHDYAGGAFSQGIAAIGSSLTTATGDITLTGIGNAAYYGGFGINISNSTVSTTGTGGTGNISFISSADRNWGGNPVSAPLYFNDAVISTVDGDIDFSADNVGASGTNRYGLYSAGSVTNTVKSTGSGNITINANAPDVGIRIDSGNTFTIGNGTSSGNITLAADTISNAGAFSAQTTGSVLFKAYSQGTTTGVAGGAGTLQITNALLNSIAAGSVTIGRSDGTGLMQVGNYNWANDISFINGSGGIEFLGGASTLTTGKAFSAVTSSGGNITNSAPGSVTTNNADITVTANGGGSITFTNFDLIANGTGNVNMAGQDVTISASNIAALNSDITITALRDILSGGAYLLQTSGTGSILLNAGRDIKISHNLDMEALGTGSITLRAKNSILYSGGGDITTHGGAITLNSDRDASGAGAIFLNGDTYLTSNGGNITLGGGANPLTDSAYGTAANPHGVYLGGYGGVNAGGGNISVRGNSSIAAGDGVKLYGEVLQTSGSGDISVNGASSTGNGIFSLATLQAGGGNINMSGATTAGNSKWGITATGSIQTTGTGNVSLTGTANIVGDFGGIGSSGVDLTAANGTISLNGSGGLYGTYVASENIHTTGSGDITVTGDGYYGIRMQYSPSIYTTGTGNISLTGISNSGLSGIYADDTILGGASNNGDITIIADILTANNVTVQTLKNVVYKTYTAATTIGVNSSAGSLQITNAILNAISAANVTIGRSDGSGLTRITGADLSARNYNLNFINGSGGIQFDGGGTALTLAADKYLTATTASGNITSIGDGGIVTSGTGYITLASGNDLSFANDFDLTTGAGAVTLQANNSILSSGGGSITTSGGAVTLNSDRDASGAGAISLSGYNTAISSNGGNITLGGGANPLATAAYGTASLDDGVFLQNGSIAAAGGNISIRGVGYSGGNHDYQTGIYQDSTISTTGNGTIFMSGTGGTSSGYSADGVVLRGSVQSQNGDITINGTRGSSSCCDADINLFYYPSITVNGSGNITLAGSYIYNYYATPATIGGSSMTGNITLQADNLAINNSSTSFQTTGTVFIKAYTASTTTGIAGASGTLQLSSALLNSITASSITIGRVDGTGAITANGYSWDKDVTFLTGTGGIALDGVQAMGAHRFVAQTTGASDIMIGASGGVSSSAPGNAIVLASARNFINNGGAGAVTVTGGGRWLVYSKNASGSTTGGLSGFKRFSSSYSGYAPGMVSESGNGFLYADASLGTISITADNTSRQYGDVNPAFSYSFNCTTGCTEAASLTGAPLLTTSATQGSNVGTYTITADIGSLTLTGAYADYLLSLSDGTLTVDPRQLTVTADNGQGKIYGASDPALTYQITSGSLYGADSFTGALSRAAGSNAGIYAISQGTLSGGSNYAITFTPGKTFSITPRALTIAADSKSKAYGASDPNFTYAITSGSLVGGDSFTGSLSRSLGEAAGNYIISLGTLSAGTNYSLNYTSALFTILAAPSGGNGSNGNTVTPLLIPQMLPNTVSWQIQNPWTNVSNIMVQNTTPQPSSPIVNVAGESEEPMVDKSLWNFLSLAPSASGNNDAAPEANAEDHMLTIDPALLKSLKLKQMDL